MNNVSKFLNKTAKDELLSSFERNVLPKIKDIIKNEDETVLNESDLEKISKSIIRATMSHKKKYDNYHTQKLSTKIKEILKNNDLTNLDTIAEKIIKLFY